MKKTIRYKAVKGTGTAGVVAGNAFNTIVEPDFGITGFFAVGNDTVGKVVGTVHIGIIFADLPI